jgi:hypothetical protein
MLAYGRRHSGPLHCPGNFLGLYLFQHAHLSFGWCRQRPVGLDCEGVDLDPAIHFKLLPVHLVGAIRRAVAYYSGHRGLSTRL